ncbi:glycosyltransferase family 9 protein [Rodentibacter caecimuris]|uniref:Heptosyltransferase n=1 Tax=Rodentibacter caecimuris TaxID=1796644 RepID=A0ABX3KVR7_9PAST|nr:heptosyltransferase [Rodentibacter heylii]
MKLKRQFRKLRIILGKFFLDKKTPENLTALYPKKILFLRQDGKIGDYIVSSFVFREIKKYKPEIHIGVVCTKKDAYLFQQNPYIDHLYFVKKRSIFDYIRQGLHLQKEQYDVVIDPTISLKNRDLLLLRLIRARNYIGYKKPNYQIFNFNIDGNYHFSEIYRLALVKIGIICQDTSYDIPTIQESQIKVRKLLSSYNIKSYISLNFFGAGNARKFTDNNIISWLTYLRKKTNLPIILLTYPSVTEKLLWMIKDFDNIFLLKESTTIFDTIEIIRQSDLVISPDTSIVHIASGLNKPMIALYSHGEDNFVHWNPNSRNIVYLLRYKNNINELSPEQIKPEWLKI